jgi:hypothetical protein
VKAKSLVTASDTGAECVSSWESLAVMLKLNVPVVELLTFTLKLVPPVSGVTLDGFGVQVVGALPAQERFTVRLYPLKAVNVPLSVTA